MRAVGYEQPGTADRADALTDFDIAEPALIGRDLLVEVRAVSINPVDTKLRRTVSPEAGERRILGFDAAGIVRAVGPNVTLFRPDDEVFYAGSIARPGTNAERHVVDERIVGRKPRLLDWAEAAALPLTSLTAWEALFARLDVRQPVPGAAAAILVIGSGGVGSIAIQFLKALTDLSVISTASGPAGHNAVRAMGADHVINHTEPLAPQIRALGIGMPGFVFSTTHSDAHRDDIAELIAPQGRFALIDDPATFDVVPFKMKAVSIHWELMFTRSLFGTADMDEQGRILNDVADLVDAGRVRTTL